MSFLCPVVVIVAPCRSQSVHVWSFNTKDGSVSFSGELTAGVELGGAVAASGPAVAAASADGRKLCAALAQGKRSPACRAATQFVGVFRKHVHP